jgi:hypothetical protein
MPPSLIIDQTLRRPVGLSTTLLWVADMAFIKWNQGEVSVFSLSIRGHRRRGSAEAKESRMSKLKNFAAVGVTAIVMAGAVAAPTMAQPYGNYDRGYNNAGRGYQNYNSNLTSSYVDSLEWRINNAAQESRLSWQQARQLRAQLRQIQGPAIYRVETGRASQGEYRRVSNVVRRIEAATQGYARNDRSPRYGHNRY